MLFNIPWWVLLMVIFIIFSGYMAFRASRAERRKLEQQFIEKEGQIFMERMEEERARRQRSS